ncbi:MAG: zinc metallopeptidase [Coriobacteriia bacterium]|nr:zinc metallopeptidase [Coriobacteriia bacterium]
MYLDPTYIVLLLVSTVIGMATQKYIDSMFKKWSAVPLATGLTGADVAKRVLNANGLHDVPVNAVSGHLTDHYDPRSRTLALSSAVYGQATVAAAGIAAHEAGHAIQHSRRYVWSSLQTAFVPVVNIGSTLAFPAIMLGLFLRISQLALLGVFLYSIAVFFQVITLPVEFNASRRALEALKVSGALSPEQIGGARQVLGAAALTYLGAALISVMQLLYYAGFARRRG